MTLDAILARSRAADEFKQDVVNLTDRREAARIRSARHSPSVKVTRVLSQLLTAEPDLAIQRVYVDAFSGCSDFDGTLVAECEDGERRFRFTWCCRWRAEQEGWSDAFGFPDQIRASREFDWQCFSRWEPMDAAGVPPDATRSAAALALA